MLPRTLLPVCCCAEFQSSSAVCISSLKLELWRGLGLHSGGGYQEGKCCNEKTLSFFLLLVHLGIEFWKLTPGSLFPSGFLWKWGQWNHPMPCAPSWAHPQPAKGQQGIPTLPALSQRLSLQSWFSSFRPCPYLCMSSLRPRLYLCFSSGAFFGDKSPDCPSLPHRFAPQSSLTVHKPEGFRKNKPKDVLQKHLTHSSLNAHLVAMQPTGWCQRWSKTSQNIENWQLVSNTQYLGPWFQSY